MSLLRSVKHSNELYMLIEIVLIIKAILENKYFAEIGVLAPCFDSIQAPRTVGKSKT